MEEVKQFAPLANSLLGAHDSSSIEDEFYFPENKEGYTPACYFTEDEVIELNVASEAVYNILVDSLDFLFDKKYENHISKFFGNDLTGKHRHFLEYAKYTYINNHPAIYGRFDIAYDFNDRKVLGFYEGNFDTPNMYFDSSVMQNHILEGAGLSENQYNLHQENLLKNLKKVISQNQAKIAFLASTSITEDVLTTETLYNIINDETDHVPFFANIDSLNLDWTNVRSPEFVLDDTKLDYVFVMYPWEDMVEDFYNAHTNPLLTWKSWADKTKFLEPAWRWFISNKCIWAWVTYLKEVLQHEDDAIKKYVEQNEKGWQYILSSYLEKPDSLVNYVKKPVLGRMSNNISYYINNEIQHDTEGFYDQEGDVFIYQELMDTTALDGRNKAIVCTWMAPWEDGSALDMESSGIAVREFTGEVLEIKSERFLPHFVEWKKHNVVNSEWAISENNNEQYKVTY